MGNLYLEDIDTKNDNSLKTLVRGIIQSQGQFSLILARCNYKKLEDCLLQKLADNSEVHFLELVLNSYIENLYDVIKTEFLLERPSALIISGLEQVSNLEEVLTLTNQAREKFRDHFQFPLVLWVTEQLLQKLIRVAPDFYNWASIPIEFELETKELIDLIEQTTDNVFDRVLKAGTGRFLDNATLGLENNSSQWLELNSAYTELKNREEKLSTELEASLEFVLGRAKQGSLDFDRQNQAREHYEKSLDLWRQLEKIEGSFSRAKFIKRLGCVLFSLGLWWGTDPGRNQYDFELAIGQAESYYQECINVFEKANLSNLVARFINTLAWSLHQLKKWDKLEDVATKALSLHKERSDRFRMARAYGFLAEVALANKRDTEATKLAEKALSTFRDEYISITYNSHSNKIKVDLDYAGFYHQGWYLFVLAKAQVKLGQVQPALSSLEKAKEKSKPEYDPRFYISILDKLQTLYFQQKEYLKAFQCKLDQHSLERQYGFRAFIGAGKLEPERLMINPALPHVEKQETIAKEISHSGRQKDIDNLVRRLERYNCNLTVIYGPSGVGKSSLLQAGLMPTLKQKTIGIYTVVPVLLQIYSGCIPELGKCLAEALIEVQNPEFTNKALTSKETILKQLHENSQKNLLTILIFDGFEGLLFSCTKLQREEVFLFLKECLNVSYTKIIISLREDYLYFLPQWNRIANLDVVNNNILDKNILYYLGNYSKKNARDLINSLMEPTQFSLEPELIEQLVEDLAEESVEIRPIELQLVGYQLETEKITTLSKYQKYIQQNNFKKSRKDSSKEIIVGNFLEEVIKACGSENEEIARLILYLLTDGNLTRPTKTIVELESYLEGKENQLRVVLQILTKSWLVLEEPGFPYDNYRLAHDYLVPLIRQNKNFELKEYIVFDVPEAQKSLFFDLLRGFEDYADLKGYKVRFSFDNTLNNQIKIKVTFSANESNVSTEQMQNDLKDYICKVQAGESIDDLPMVLPEPQHQALLLALKNRISFLQHTYEVQQNAIYFYETILKGAGKLLNSSIPKQNTQIVNLLNSADNIMSHENYTANNSPGAAVGKRNIVQENTIEQSITIGESKDSRQFQADRIAELIEVIRNCDSSDEETKKKASNYLDNVKEELIEEEKPSKSRIQKWLSKAKPLLDILGEAGEVYDKAKEVFSSFHIPWQ